MPQEVIIISEKLRNELFSRVHETLERESHKLRVIQSELRSASRMKTRTAGWKREKEDAQKRVELYTTFLTILNTGKFFPPAGSSLPEVVLLESIPKVGLLEQGLSFARAVYRKAVEVQAEVKATLWSI